MVEFLKERGLANARIGTIAALGGPNLAPVGWTPHGMWTSLAAALPDVIWVEMWDEFMPIWLSKSAEEIARESYDAAIATIRAGVPFGEVAEAMQEPLRRAGAWHLTPHIHSCTPLTLVSPVTEDIDPSVKNAFKLDGLGDIQGQDPGILAKLDRPAAMPRRLLTKTAPGRTGTAPSSSRPARPSFSQCSIIAENHV